jgi:hypothetical protein
MKKLLLVSGLAAITGLLPLLAAAQEVGKVISSTPITREKTGPRVVCSQDMRGREQCSNVNMTEGSGAGYMVEYEYKGKRYTTEMPNKPGATIELEVAATPRSGVIESRTEPRSAPAPTYTEAAPEARYVEREYSEPAYSYEPVVRERVIREPVYIERPYYYSSPYYSSYYSPWYPVVGLALGYSVGRHWNHHHGWRHHHHHRGHGRR